MAKKISGRGFWAITPDGYTVHINGKRDMSQEILDAVLSLMDLAAKNATEKMPCGHTRADVVSEGIAVPLAIYNRGYRVLLFTSSTQGNRNEQPTKVTT